MGDNKMRRLSTCLNKIRDLPCLLGVIILIVSVAITVRADENPKDTLLQDQQALTHGIAKRSKDNQHKFGWGKRSRASRIQLRDSFDDDAAKEFAYEGSKRDDSEAAPAERRFSPLCRPGASGCLLSGHRNGWEVGYGKRSLDDEDEFLDSEDEDSLNEEESNAIARAANDDRNGWGGNYGRDVEDSPSELNALLSAARRRLVETEVTKRHGNGWHGAYGKRARNSLSHGKRKRSVSKA